MEKRSKGFNDYCDPFYSMRALHYDIESFLVQYKGIIVFAMFVIVLLIAISYYVVQRFSLYRRMRYRRNASDAQSDSSSNDGDTKSIETTILTGVSIKY